MITGALIGLLIGIIATVVVQPFMHPRGECHLYGSVWKCPTTYLTPLMGVMVGIVFSM